MARSVPKSGGSSVTEATTLIFPKESTWSDLAKVKRETKARAASHTGIYGAAVKDAVENKHVDRKALSIVLKLHGMEDEDLHVTLFHLIDGLKKLGVLKRGMAQEEMFDDRKIDGGALDAAEKALKKQRGGKKPKAAKKANGKSNVVSIGEAVRDVAEKAGADLSPR